MVLGPDFSAIPSLLKEQYQFTIILYKPHMSSKKLCASSLQDLAAVRVVRVLTLDDQGNRCPTKETAAILTLHTEKHQAPAYWVRPDHFLPERWLADRGDEIRPMREAFRAFEIGPRICVAQGYMVTELPVILVSIARQFDFRTTCDERDRLHFRQGLRTYRCERVYQTEEGAAHPMEHPCRVSIRET